MTNKAGSMQVITVGAKGRVVLPAPIRRALGMRQGDRLTVRAEPDGSLRLIRIADAVEAMRGFYRHLAPGRSLVDELIAERREEALREEDQ